MKRKSLLSLMLIAFAFFGVARADEVTIGSLDGAANNSYLPMNSLYNYSYTQQIYTADEIGMAGTINSITVWMYGNANLYEMPFNIYMVETDKDAFESNTDWETVTSDDIVYTGTVTVHNTEAEAYTFELDSPFSYSGTGNLLIAFNNTTGSWKSGLNGKVFGAATDPVRAIYARQDSGAYDPYNPTFSAYGTTYQRNVIELVIIPTGGVVCEKPESIEVSNINENGATVTWTGGSGTYNLQMKAVSAENWNDVMLNTTATSFGFVGLNPATTYNVRVQSVCSGDATSGWKSTSFTTNCGTITNFPWTEDFESYASGDFVDPCWVNEHIEGTGTSIFKVYTSAMGDNSTHKLQLPDMSIGTMTKLVLPEMNVPANYEFSIDIYRSNSTYNNNYPDEGIRVFVSTDGEIEGATELAFIPRHFEVSNDVIPAESAVGWYTYELPIGMSGSCYIILRGESQYCTATYMDNFAVKAIPTCPKPTGLAVTANSVTAHNATITWTENGEANTWIVEFATDADFTEFLTETVEDTPTYTFQGLEPETTYYVRVKAHCGPGDESEYSNVVNFTTPIACPAPTSISFTNITGHAATLSWTGSADSYDVMLRTTPTATGLYQSFGTSIPTGWSMYNGLLGGVLADTVNLTAATYGWAFGQNNGVFDNHARVNIYGTSCMKWLVMPAVTVPAGGNFTFDIALTKYSGTLLPVADTLQQDDKFVVLISTDDMAHWTILREWNNTGSSYVYNNIACSAEGEPVSINLSSYVGQNVRIAFYGESTVAGGDNNLHIDNVLIGTQIPAGEWQVFNTTETTYTFTGLAPMSTYEVKVASSCPDEVGHETAVYSFTTNVACPKPTALVASEIGPNSFKLAWTENGEASAWQIQVDDNTPIDVTTNPYTVTGLEPETGYAVKVRSNGGSDGYSEWSTIITVTTNVACPTPSNLQVTNLTAYSATVTWTGFNDGYNVTFSYPGDPLFNIDFENQTIPSTWNNTATADTLIWTVVTDTIHNSYYMKSGNAGVSSSTSTISFQYSLEYDGFISFDAECRGEGSYTYYDHCDFYIDEERKIYAGSNISGWNHYIFPVPAGTHTFTWSYTKDTSVNPSGDYFAVDNVDISYYSGTTFYVENTEYTFNDLTPETTYFVKVRGICDGVGTEWSETVSFTTPEITTLTQTIALGAGANWCSFNVEVALDDLKAILVEAAPGATSANPIMISSQNQNVRYNGMRWLGSLNFDLSKMYRITVPVACEITVEGMPIDPASYPVEIAPGTNWIAYPLNTNMQVSAAFADFAVNGDVVKHQNGNASYRNNRWLGSFEMQPGKGYKYVSADTETKTYTFPIAK
jgi:hypothetical protein